MQKIVLFASGAGSNCQAIIDFFKSNTDVEVATIVTNNPNAGVIAMAIAHNIPYKIINRASLTNDIFLAEMQAINPTIIVLAGFLLKIPEQFVQCFKGKIINIHPSLLPLHGGKGMYGANVHHQVLENKEQESGITIHYVDEIYDHGSTIVQARCPVYQNDSVASLSSRIHKLEHFYFPRTIEFLLESTRDKPVI